ncbi:Methyl-accepting chemotaxis protein [Halapricum desulfuricans]|uniref:Methyl-accepting chemotaxis protein n=1 Tax=Halapricum desulfuricans TaxID=2841257 RepID=A0A897NP28_9EURY|nr:Methyl-accepting chemotaxis protein [Halapricum desulfuricans]
MPSCSIRIRHRIGQSVIYIARLDSGRSRQTSRINANADRSTNCPINRLLFFICDRRYRWISESNINRDIDRDIDELEENIDRSAGYDHEAASEIQTSVAKLEDSSVEIDDQTGQIVDINQAVDDLVEDLARNTATADD